MKSNVGLDYATSGLDEVLMLVDGVLALEQIDVGAKSHLAKAIGVEVELIFDNVGEVFIHLDRTMFFSQGTGGWRVGPVRRFSTPAG